MGRLQEPGQDMLELLGLEKKLLIKRPLSQLIKSSLEIDLVFYKVKLFPNWTLVKIFHRKQESFFDLSGSSK